MTSAGPIPQMQSNKKESLPYVVGGGELNPSLVEKAIQALDGIIHPGSLPGIFSQIETIYIEVDPDSTSSDTW